MVFKFLQEKEAYVRWDGKTHRVTILSGHITSSFETGAWNAQGEDLSNSGRITLGPGDSFQYAKGRLNSKFYQPVDPLICPRCECERWPFEMADYLCQDCR